MMKVDYTILLRSFQTSFVMHVKLLAFGPVAPVSKPARFGRDGPDSFETGSCTGPELPNGLRR